MNLCACAISNKTRNKKINTIVMKKYKIKNIISKGSFGKVYLGQNITNKELVIIKVIRKRDTPNNINIRVIKDSEIPRILCHDNIIKVLEYGTSQSYHYIIYPYLVNSIPLSNIPMEKLNLRIKNNLIFILKVSYQISDAIEHMHSKQVIHRDIKPQNILINENTSLLIDFDLSSVLNVPRYPLKVGFVGSPYYVAPELWRNDFELTPIDYIMTDIYSLGVTFYFIFNKKTHPYHAECMNDLEYAIFYVQPNKSNSGITVIDNLIMKMIDKNPENRPKINEIKNTIKNLLDVL